MANNWLEEWWLLCTEKKAETLPSLQLFCAKAIYLGSAKQSKDQQMVGIVQTPSPPVQNTDTDELLIMHEYITHLNLMDLFNRVRFSDHTQTFEQLNANLVMRANDEIQNVNHLLPQQTQDYLNIPQDSIKALYRDYFPPDASECCISLKIPRHYPFKEHETIDREFLKAIGRCTHWDLAHTQQNVRRHRIFMACEQCAERNQDLTKPVR